MNLVTVKTKHQITLPASIRKQAGIEVGDILEVTIEKGKITLNPKNVIDQAIARGLDDIKHGRTSGPLRTPEEVNAYFNKIIKQHKKKR
jgi:AbrB family looped-hinge helix DNA binding protein